MTDKHMGVADVKRRFADVVGEVMHGRKRIIVERRGRPVVAIVPLEQAADRRRPGQRVAAAVGCADEDGETFRRLMGEVVSRRRRRMPRRVAERAG
jgi:prevent-host-death family protein